MLSCQTSTSTLHPFHLDHQLKLDLLFVSSMALKPGIILGCSTQVVSHRCQILTHDMKSWIKLIPIIYLQSIPMYPTGLLSRVGRYANVSISPLSDGQGQ
jgi:hypothetical protein